MWPVILCTAGAALFALSFVLPVLQHGLEVRRLRRARAVPRAREPLGLSPSMEIIIPAYLEASVIPGTVSALRRALEKYDGPARITIVASDPETAMASRSADTVVQTARHGKAAATNAGVRQSSADVIVLTDANCQVLPEDWTQIVVDELATNDLVSANKWEDQGAERAFWNIERDIKRRFSNSIGTVSVVGEFIAFRRNDFVDIPPGTILDDLWLAVEFAGRGLKPTIADRLATIEPAATRRDQWERRVRMAIGLFTEQVPYLARLRQTPQGRLFIVHKLYRMTVGCAGYWLAVAGLAFVARPWSYVAPAAAILAVFAYAGAVPWPRWLLPVTAPAGMQGVPIAALLRILSGGAKAAGVWKKVAR